MCIKPKITPKAYARCDIIVFKGYAALLIVKKIYLGNAYCIAGKKKGKLEFTKGGFYSEREMRFSNLQISKKYTPNHHPELEI